MAPEHGDGIKRKAPDKPGKNLRTGGIAQRNWGILPETAERTSARLPLSSGTPPLPAQHLPDLVQQILRADRLYDQVTALFQQAFSLDDIRRISADEDCPDIAPHFSDLIIGLLAVHFRHDQVKEQELNPLPVFGESANRIRTVHRLNDRIAELCEDDFNSSRSSASSSASSIVSVPSPAADVGRLCIVTFSTLEQRQIYPECGPLPGSL